MMIKQYIKQLKAINKKGKEYYNFLLRNCRSFNNTSIIQKREKVIKKYGIRIRPKSCFYNAQQLAIFSKGEFKYCEGYAITKVIGFPVEHAWNIKDGKIIDLSWEDGMEYFGISIQQKWIKKKFYEYAFKYNISTSQLINYWEEKHQNEKRNNKDSKQKMPGLRQGGFYSLQRNSKNCFS